MMTGLSTHKILVKIPPTEPRRAGVPRSPARSRRERARERMYRELVFESAEHVIAAKGLDATTMQEIAAEAGISLRTLYATFPSKEELVAEVQRVRGEGIVAEIS